ncbi:MAG: DNA gyrase subunit A [Nitrospirota bacterium]
MNKGVVQVNIEDEMKSSYIDYAMSVIVGRALPDVRDGLKPVHRRILYAMFREGLLSNRRYSKSAGVVGEVIKKYHPHGDAAVYDALVRMAQNFNMRYPLIDGQGNFGSVDGDPPAAYRYTEAKLTSIAEDMLTDIDMETVDLIPNFDESAMEPTVLPSKIPNLLINGSSGIAVGMATNIPPHNLGEVIDGLLMMLDNPQVTLNELMTVIKGPDFPTAGYIYGYKAIRNAYETGRGVLQLRAKVFIEVNPRTDKETIIITELPYQVNKARLIEKIADLVKDKKIEGITDVRDESDREGMRVVIELKKGEISGVILNKLYNHTQMQTSFGIIMLSLSNNQPKVLNLTDMLHSFQEHRREIILRRTQFELRKAKEKAHILEGLKIALEHLDEIITLIKGSESPEEARNSLIDRYLLSRIQAQAILDMKLQRLTGLEREKLIEDYQKTIRQIEHLESILGSEELVRNIIKNELIEIKEKYQDERRTEIIPETKEIEIEDMIAQEDMVITISHDGYIKRNPLSVYRRQSRGTKGKMGMETKKEDFLEHLFVAATHDYLLFFTDAGKVYWLKVYQLPEVGRMARGKPIVNLLQVAEGESVTAILTISEFREDRYVIMATKNGIVKKTTLNAYSNPRVGGIIALTLDNDDRLIEATLSNGDEDVILGTKNGLVIRFSEKSVRAIGRTGRGVIGIRLAYDDEVVGMKIVHDDSNSTILSITERGYGKRSAISEYRTQSRGGKGVIGIKASKRNGKAVGLLNVSEEDEIMLVTTQGKILRLKTKDIRVIGRNTQGVKLINVEEYNRVVSVATLAEKEEEEEEHED